MRGRKDFPIGIVLFIIFIIVLGAVYLFYLADSFLFANGDLSTFLSFSLDFNRDVDRCVPHHTLFDYYTLWFCEKKELGSYLCVRVSLMVDCSNDCLYRYDW